MNFLQRYKPTTIQGMIGNSKQAGEVLDFVSSCVNDHRGGVLIVSGPAGTGKTLSLEIIAKQFGYELVEYDELESAISSCAQQSMFYKGKIVIIDLDCCKNLRNLKDLVASSRSPVILMTQDIWNSRYASIRSSFKKTVKFFKLNSLSLESFLKKVCAAEDIAFGVSAIKEFAKTCDGDARFAMNALESFASSGVTSEIVGSSGRDGVYSVFDVMNSIFYGTAERNKLSGVDQFMLVNQLRNKLADVYKGERLARAMRCLANADLFKSRVMKRQAWTLEKYWYDFVSFIGKS